MKKPNFLVVLTDQQRFDTIAVAAGEMARAELINRSASIMLFFKHVECHSKCNT